MFSMEWGVSPIQHWVTIWNFWRIIVIEVTVSKDSLDWKWNWFSSFHFWASNRTPKKSPISPYLGAKSRIWRYIARNGNTGCWLASANGGKEALAGIRLALGALSKCYQTCIVTNRRFFIKYSILLNEIGFKNQETSGSPDCLLFALTFWLELIRILPCLLQANFNFTILYCAVLQLFCIIFEKHTSFFHSDDTRP